MLSESRIALFLQSVDMNLSRSSCGKNADTRKKYKEDRLVAKLSPPSKHIQNN